MRVLLGADPGLAHFGWALVRLDKACDVVLAMGCFVSEKSDKKRGVLVADDNVRRTRELVKVLRDLSLHIPTGARIVGVAAESMSHPRSSSAAAKLSLSWGALIALADLQGWPIVQASPQEIKKAVCGSKAASKENVQDALNASILNASVKGLAWTDRALEQAAGFTKGDREHPYDALAAVVAARQSPIVMALRQ